MTGRGRVRFECQECQHLWLPRRCEWGRAAGISCPACGSRFWLESKAARKEKKLGRPAERTVALSEDVRRALRQGR